MNIKKITTILLATVTAFSLSTTFAVPASSQTVEAATVVHSSQYETVTLFTISDLKDLTGIALKSSNVSSVYNKLTQSGTWTKAGYSSSHASLIASRFSQSKDQAVGILTKLTYTNELSLKVVVLDKQNVKNVNIGVSGELGGDDYDEEIDETTAVDNGNTGNSGNTGGTGVVAGSLKELEVEIEYKNGEVQLEYQISSNGTVKAQFESDFTGEDLQNKAAQAKIEAILAGLDIQNSSQSQIAEHIINQLGLGSNYKQFQFEAQYYNASKVEFKLK